MSYSVPGVQISLKSSGDMSSHQYKAVQASTTNATDGCTVVAARGAALTGVYQNNSTASEAGLVMLTGVSKVVAGDSSAMDNAITAGKRVCASSVGAAVPSTVAGQHLIGIALEPLTTGSTGVIAVLLTPGAIST